MKHKWRNKLGKTHRGDNFKGNTVRNTKNTQELRHMRQTHWQRIYTGDA